MTTLKNHTPPDIATLKIIRIGIDGDQPFVDIAVDITGTEVRLYEDEILRLIDKRPPPSEPPRYTPTTTDKGT